MHRHIRACILIVLSAVLAGLLSLPPKACAQATATTAELRISGVVSTPLVLSVADLKKIPRKTLAVVNPHDKKKETYEGVLLEEILHRAGDPQGDQLRGSSMATYVVAEGQDGYRVVFSLAELDSGIVESEVIVADTMDGVPLADNKVPSDWSPAGETPCPLGPNAQVNYSRPRRGSITSSPVLGAREAR